MFLLKISVLVASDAAADVPTCCQKYQFFNRKHSCEQRSLAPPTSSPPPRHEMEYECDPTRTVEMLTCYIVYDMCRCERISGPTANISPCRLGGFVAL